MELDNRLNDIFMDKRELGVISSALVEFAQEAHWKLISANENIFKSEFEKKFGFSITELDYVEESISDIEFNFRSIDIEKISIHVSDKNHAAKKPIIIYSALNECSKNYEDYEISIRTGITKQGLDNVLKDFKEKVIDVIYKDLKAS